MLVKLFDFEHERDLEDAINTFLSQGEIEVKTIKYCSSHFFALGEQVFSFSALILYEKTSKKV